MKNLISIISLSATLVLLSGCASDSIESKSSQPQTTSSVENVVEQKKEDLPKLSASKKEDVKIEEKKAELPIKKEVKQSPLPNLFLQLISTSNKVKISDIGTGTVYGGDSLNGDLKLWYKAPKSKGAIVFNSNRLTSLYCESLVDISFYPKNPETEKVEPLFSNSCKDVKNLFIAVTKESNGLKFYPVNIHLKKDDDKVYLLNSSNFEAKIITNGNEFILKNGDSLPVKIKNSNYFVRIETRKDASKRFRPVFSGTIEIPTGTKVIFMSLSDEKSGDISIQNIILN